MLFKLHTTDLSPFGQRAKLALRAKGLLPQTELNDTFGGTDALGELAPMRQIPILEHDGFVLPESQVIVDYLEDIATDTSLLPTHPRARAIARLLVRITDLYIAPHFLTLIVGMRPPPDPIKMTEAFAALNKGLGFAEQYLQSENFSGAQRTEAEIAYAVGETLSIADIALAPFLFYVPRLAEWHGHDAFPAARKCAAYLSAVAKTEHIHKAFIEMEIAYKVRIDMLKK
ncbi:MAG: glutathione S-transferase family protein [Hyphomonadaceae bacterium]